jgi:hypothetical protein
MLIQILEYVMYGVDVNAAKAEVFGANVVR